VSESTATFTSVRDHIAALEETNRQLLAQVISVSDCYGYNHAHHAARIVELEARNERGSATIANCMGQIADIRKQLGCPQDRHVGLFAKKTRQRAENAEAAIEQLRTALVAIQSTTPGSAHRIAIQALTERIHCDSVDEYTCTECSGHNRCEDEMDAGFGDYGRDDPREDR